MALNAAHTLVIPPSPGVLESPSITCVSLSNDQRRLFSGDARGRVFAWCLPDASGKTNEHWLKDSVTAACMGTVRVHFLSERADVVSCFDFSFFLETSL